MSNACIFDYTEAERNRAVELYLREGYSLDEPVDMQIQMLYLETARSELKRRGPMPVLLAASKAAQKITDEVEPIKFKVFNSEDGQLCMSIYHVINILTGILEPKRDIRRSIVDCVATLLLCDLEQAKTQEAKNDDWT